MRLFRFSQRATAFLAVVALVWAALAPTLVQAARAAPSGWLQVCGASGMVWVALPDKVSPGQDAEGGHKVPGLKAMAECPWCTHHAGHTGLPPRGGVFIGSMGARADWEPVRVHLQTSAPRWGVLSRAPPLDRSFSLSRV
jgi:Protein of unknown function (DUF2946)